MATSKCDEIVLAVPWPPSTNSYWRHPSRGPLAGRHLISERGRAYRKEIAVLALQAGSMRQGRLSIELMAHPPDRRVRDLDNVLKGLLDALVHAGVIADDGLIDRLVIERQAVAPPGRIDVRIKIFGE